MSAEMAADALVIARYWAGKTARTLVRNLILQSPSPSIALTARYSVDLRVLTSRCAVRPDCSGGSMIANAEDLALAQSLFDQHGFNALDRAEEVLQSNASQGNRDLAEKWLRVVVLLEYTRVK